MMDAKKPRCAHRGFGVFASARLPGAILPLLAREGGRTWLNTPSQKPKRSSIRRPIIARRTNCSATLTREEKARALDMWEQDARQMLTASNEGMPGSAEGTQRSDHSRLGQVERAKLKLGKKPRPKPAH